MFGNIENVVTYLNHGSEAEYEGQTLTSHLLFKLF